MPAPREHLEHPRPRALSVVRRIAPDGLLRDRYRILDVIGEGAHGVSFLARHEFLNHPCVVKILPHSVASSGDNAVKRLRNEARAGFRVNHPNVVRVLDCDVIDHVWYFVMEYVDGVDLDAILLRRAVVPWQQVVSIGRQAALGLAAIHAAGLLHRDIKPGNLLLGCDGRLRVGDLGVAAFTEADALVEEPAWMTAAGTFQYMAPEVLSIDTLVDERSDIYSIGATLYHLLTGRTLHARGGLLGTLLDAQNRPATWPADARSDIPLWLSDLVLECLEIEPEDRLSSATSLANRLVPTDVQTTPSFPAQPERLTPRGLAVLPFENLDGDARYDWMGAAIAEYLGNQLAHVRDVYTTDHDQVLKVLADLEKQQIHGGDRFLRACRLLGAATVVGGEYRIRDEQIVITGTLQKSDDSFATRFATVHGAKVEFGRLERRLMDALARSLGIESRWAGESSAGDAPTLSLRAQEHYVEARSAFLGGDYQRAINIAREAAELDPDYAELMGFIGACQARLGDYAQAERWHRRLEDLARRKGDDRLLVEAHANLGTMYFFKGEYGPALEYFRAAVTLAESLGMPEALAQIHNNLGFVLMRLGRSQEAENAFRGAIRTHQAYGAVVSLVAPYNGMGSVLVDLGRLDEARHYYEEALELAHEIGDRAKVGVSHMNLARCAAAQRDYASAKLEFAACFNALEETSFWNGLTRAFEYVADMNLELRNFAEAARCADRRIQLARLHKNLPMESAAWTQKGRALEQAGRPDQAAECFDYAAQLANQAAGSGGCENADARS